MNINVNKHTKQPSQDFFAERLERAWETKEISINQTSVAQLAEKLTHGMSVVMGKISSLFI